MGVRKQGSPTRTGRFGLGQDMIMYKKARRCLPGEIAHTLWPPWLFDSSVYLFNNCFIASREYSSRPRYNYSIMSPCIFRHRRFAQADNKREQVSGGPSAAGEGRMPGFVLLLLRAALLTKLI